MALRRAGDTEQRTMVELSVVTYRPRDMTRLAVLAVGLGLLLGACTTDDTPSATPTRKTSPAEGPVMNDNSEVVPDVLHMALPTAYQRLRRIGFKVTFTPNTRRYRRYAKGLEGLDPGLWVAEIFPSPGQSILLKTPVVITELECPQRRNECE